MSRLASTFTTLLCVLLISVKVVSGINQRFSASAKHPSLKRTTTKFEPSYDFQKLVYYNVPQQDSDVELGASILLEPKYPLLIHEDIDYAIRRIQCTEDEMTVFFEGYDYMQMALDTWSAEEEFVIVTHARSCADGGEHAAYLVQLDTARYTGYRLRLRGYKTTLKAVTHRMFVDMGAHVVPQVDKERWKRLQQSLTEVSTVVVLTTVDAGDSSTLAQQTSVQTTTVASNSPESTPETSAGDYSATATLATDASETFSFAAPTGSPTEGSMSSDISFSEVGLVLMPPDQSITDSGISYPTIDSVLVKCLNCSGTGQISFSSAGFTMSGDYVEDARNFLDNGYLEFDAASLSAYMYLELQLQPGFSISSFKNSLKRKQLGSIQIANVIVIEPVLDFGVPVDITLQSPITIEAGFTFTNPDTGKIVLNMSEISSSYASGFDHPSINALPFNADVPDLSFELSVAFKPKMSVNIGLTESAKNDTDGEFDLNGGFGVYVEIPKLKLDISEKHNVDANCQPSSDQNTAIAISPGIEWTAGYTAQVDIAGVFDYSTPKGDGVLFDQNLGFGQVCMIWDANILGFVDPTATSSLASASGTAALSASLASVSASNALASASSVLATAAGGAGSASAASAVASATSAVAAASSASASVSHHNVASRPQMDQVWSTWSLLGLLLSYIFNI